jgi:RNA polymerase sigma-70 factor (ECF subfamily)
MPTPFSAARLLAELPRLRRYARILTDDPEYADRLVEETLAQARQMPDTSAHDSTRSTQLLALLRDVNARETATSTSRETPPSAPFADPRPKTDADPGGRITQLPPDRGAAMLAQLRELPLEQREVLVLVAVERLSYAEIAALLHTPVATVISRLAQARETLRARSSSPLSAPSAN